ncbi:flagellar biosynthesis protein FlhF [Bacillus sp. DJP31]|uniref:flagellar biosynthesis protein FlhF n=1 Tax=Bacillus sp. DJP31 TaxID=3409789 RepID=UPI003BB7F566
MKVKKYVAPTMPEAMKKIRAELGKDAVILNSKVIHTGGIFGFFTKKNIEVIAALDPSPLDRQPVQKEKPRPIQPSVNETLWTKPISKIEDKSMERNDSNLKNEIDELKILLKDLSTNQHHISTTLYPEQLQKVEMKLMEQEVDLAIRVELMSSLVELWYKNNSKASEREIEGWLRQLLFQKVEQFQHGGISFQKKFINVVGPTGVGKTTTLAKMAANCVLKHNKKVAFITTDTYRIAAIEQLKTYAKILDVPIEVCYNLDDFVKAKENFSSFDLVFIDTAGRNFRNKQYVEDLNEVINFSDEMETFLVLSLTAKIKDMNEIYKQFSIVDIHRFIFTKADETSQYGAILNLMLAHKKGVAYVTTGQNVPDDIVEATPEILIQTLLGEEKK